MVRNEYATLVATIQRNLDPNSNHVLIVDDERGIRMKVARDVRGVAQNVVVHEASNGKEALEKLEFIRKTHRKDPLFIVLDLQMPIMDGWETISRLKEEYEEAGKAAGVPIIVLSSTSGEKSFALIMKKSVHQGKTGYTPLVSIAKENCVDDSRYDASGEAGLMGWLEYFLNK
ncbi:MAG: response regulator [Lentisphaerales bacterium]|nr:MAG: response regulator [Lentisphaerales bacterium]